VFCYNKRNATIAIKATVAMDHMEVCDAALKQLVSSADTAKSNSLLIADLITVWRETKNKHS